MGLEEQRPKAQPRAADLFPWSEPNLSGCAGASLFQVSRDEAEILFSGRRGRHVTPAEVIDNLEGATWVMRWAGSAA
jgi:hypothetical protein